MFDILNKSCSFYLKRVVGCLLANPSLLIKLVLQEWFLKDTFSSLTDRMTQSVSNSIYTPRGSVLDTAKCCI